MDNTEKAANPLEEGVRLRLDFTKLKSVAATGLDVIPAVAQDAKSGRVLIIGYVNQTALDCSLRRGVACFWSTSRNELWVKGETSGDFLDIQEIRVNCEQNSLLYLVSPRGRGACHTRDRDGNARASCFYRRIKDGGLEFVD